MTPTNRKEHFTKIPDSIGEAAWMTGSLLYIYYAIAKHLNYKNPQEPAFPSQARIARITKLSLRQVKRLVKVLEQRGVFERIPGRGGHSTRYRFHQGVGTWVSPGGVVGVPSGGDMGGTLSRAIEREPLNKKDRGKCSHPDTARCSKCLTPTVVARPVSPAPPQSVSPASPQSESLNPEDYF